MAKPRTRTVRARHGEELTQRRAPRPAPRRTGTRAGVLRDAMRDYR